MIEIWRDVDGYEGIYEVSDKGRVRTHKDKITFTKKHGIRKWKQRILREKNPTGRDVRVSLWKDGKEKSFLVHRLVALAFIPKIEGKECVNHIDGNPRNNHVSNLEWCDYKDNNRHAFDNNLIKTSKKVVLIGEGFIYEFNSMSKASVFLGKNKGYISAVLKRDKKKARSNNGRTYEVRLS